MNHYEFDRLWTRSSFKIIKSSILKFFVLQSSFKVVKKHYCFGKSMDTTKDRNYF
jgi:hypothetical protein